MRNQGFGALFIFLLVLISFNFFGANFLNVNFVHYTNLAFCSIAILLAVPYAFIKGNAFELPVQLISISVVISVFMAYLAWGQSFIYSIQVTIPLLLWIFFFYLLHIKIPVKTIEAIVFIYAFIYIVLYFFQFSNPGTLFFGVEQQYTEWYYERGIFRIIFPGGGIFFLAVFIALNKLTTQKKGKLVWLVFAALGIIIPVMQATRTYIAGVLIIYLYHFLKGQSIIKKLAFIAFAAGFFIAIINLDIPVLRGLAQAQQETQKQGLDNQRITTGLYFLTEFSPDVFSNVFGNGVPAASNQSRYGKFVENLAPQDIFMYDVGIIGMFTMFGILAITGYIIIWFKSFTLPLPKNYYYVKYYLWFLIVTCLTYDAVYSNYFLITTVFALYIFQRIYNEEKLKNKESVSLQQLDYSVDKE